ncbi:MAG: hypothetical protein WCQ32_00545 [bacterium]
MKKIYQFLVVVIIVVFSSCAASKPQMPVIISTTNPVSATPAVVNQAPMVQPQQNQLMYTFIPGEVVVPMNEYMNTEGTGYIATPPVTNPSWNTFYNEYTKQWYDDAPQAVGSGKYASVKFLYQDQQGHIYEKMLTAEFETTVGLGDFAKEIYLKTTNGYLAKYQYPNGTVPYIPGAGFHKVGLRFFGGKLWITSH